MEVLVVPVVVPLVEVSAVSDGVGVKPVKSILQRVTQRFVGAKRACCLQSIGEQLADDSQVGRTTIHGCALISFGVDVESLGRCAWRGDELFGILRVGVQRRVTTVCHDPKELGVGLVVLGLPDFVVGGIEGDTQRRLIVHHIFGSIKNRMRPCVW